MSHSGNSPDDAWLGALHAGDSDTAWDLFIAQYRRLIFGTIRHYTREHDEAMDAFAHVCIALHCNRLARLQRYWDRPTHTARFSSWLVTIVRHQVVDWLRQHRLRRHPPFIAALPVLQQQIFDLIFIQARSHVEAYEVLRTTTDSTLSFASFVSELRGTYEAVDASRWRPLAREITGPGPLAAAEAVADSEREYAVIFDTRLRLRNALNSLKPDERLAVELLVVHEMPAMAIARALRWPNAKAVYNRVYRALEAIRAGLARQGIRREDL